jgi:hypothetical protein
MAQLINEAKRMQQLAGIIKENEETQVAAAAEKVDDKAAEDTKLKTSIGKLTDQQKAELVKTLTSLGITANSSVKDVMKKIEPKLEKVIQEGEGDMQQKVANGLSVVGGSLMKSLLVPIIPVAIGSLGVGVAGGVAITAAVAGLLIGAAKLLGAENKQ